MKNRVDITTRIIQVANSEQGLEFVYAWDGVRSSIIVMGPFFLSTIFPTIWIPLMLKRGGDLQTTMQTAFTIASYIVTASTSKLSFVICVTVLGAVIIALITLLDALSQRTPELEGWKSTDTIQGTESAI